ncbi:MAG: ABC transporter substrate-binding protein [Sediminibacterium sp.]
MRLTLIILVASSFLLMNCSSRINNNKKVFYYNESSGIATLDPAFAKNQSIMWAIHQIYSTLVEIDTGLHIVPSIAKNWQVSVDRLTYTFNIRQGIYFHDNEAFENGKGRALTAHDIVYSFNRIQEKKTASSGAWIFNNRVDTIRPFIALNDSTFQLHLLKPFQPILGILSTQYCSIVPKEVVEKYGKDFRRHPCGTGPFQFQSWDEGQALILHKNEQYFEQDGSAKRLPYLDAIKVSFFDNKATEFLQFQQGNLSFINDIDPSFKDEVITKNGMLRKEWDGKVLLKKQPYLNTEYLGILVDSSNPIVKNSPLKLKAIRQAMNYAINKQQLMLYMRNSIGIPAEAGFVPRGLPSHNAELVKGYPFNPTKAKQLLISAGFSKQNQLPVIKLLTIAIYSDIASFIAKQLEEIGFNIQVEVVQKSLLLEQTAKSQAGFFRGSWIADYPDAENYMAMFYSKNPAPPNYTRYKNLAFDLLYEKALVTINDEERYDLYRQMDQMVINDAPVIPIWYDMAFHLTQTNLINFEPNALNLLELRRTNYK